ncbi:HIRAN domain-containing protein [Candidatus Laterigemmans baculatus]|uniref:HIRAN domain-containing protein n=1 Tax=Candidatus Laterigemmans baculatus TaxID=2770505 RepID=UPI0013D9959C|nr:HIRAN domain-containing protein [Candidatus Laterigemmans baculatus]
MSEVEVFVCSFCEKPVRYRQEQRGRSGKCPSCAQPIVLVNNHDRVVDDQLTTTWYYRRLRLLRGREEVGPIPDTQLLELIDAEQIDGSTEVMSPELTKDTWVELGRVKLSLVRERIAQRAAEHTRRQKAEERRRRAELQNRAKLKRGIRSAIETGSLSSGHRAAVEQFALKAGIPADEVQATISSECEGLVREVFEEAIDDGILDPREEEQLSQLAISLGVDLKFSERDQRRILLCRLAYELDSGNHQPDTASSVPFKLGSNEQLLFHVPVQWHEIVSLKRPAGIPLGGDSYLKEIGSGVGYLTTKQLSMVGDLQSKKFTLSSVQKVTRYADGVLFNRSSGRSVFLEMNPMSEMQEQFALVAEHACSGQPVLGHAATSSFIPEVVNAELVAVSGVSGSRIQHSGADPKYTFRVVGDFVGNRSALIARLNIGDEVMLHREPSNPADPNAVAVYDLSRNQLGYLKRDVASWFAPILDRKPSVEAKAHAVTSAGSLIVGVYL